jgi:hypothetical protein
MQGRLVAVLVAADGGLRTVKRVQHVLAARGAAEARDDGTVCPHDRSLPAAPGTDVVVAADTHSSPLSCVHEDRSRLPDCFSSSSLWRRAEA